MSTGYDWARNAFYFSSMPAAVVFGVVSAGFAVALVCNAFFGPVSRRAYYFLIVWAVLRLVAFILRAVSLIGNNGTNLSLVIIAVVFSSIGYLPLVKVFVRSVLICIQDLYPSFPYARVDRFLNKVYVVAVALIIAYLNMYLPNLPAAITPSEQMMRDAAYWILALVSIIPTLAVICLLLFNPRFSQFSWVLLVQGLLLVLKIAFTLYKNYNGGANDEGYFYAFTIVPEFVFMFFYLFPSALADPIAFLDHTDMTDTTQNGGMWGLVSV
ncbi:hypothetical protein HDU83_009270 [Entophlyctis luteolus]|nr:hypothetical protein HDU82_001470 [Entophlyctis luteolus]KAJ3351079.1 hypothetical protein HDU83_009270 [Entophlyctis luteolus]KAJ3390594.1 hypothetical protein HDU84_007295 [Entophlyctis sp. JEL0112]